MPSTRSSRAARLGVAALVTIGLSGLVVTTTSASDGGSLEVRIRDNCDAATFNAVIPNVCQGSGNTTFDQFVGAIASGGHPKWRFQPASTEVNRGTRVTVVNRGGEQHTFTEVTQFGTTGFLPLLDSALGPNAPEWKPIAPPVPVAQGGTQDLGVLPPGTHMFQCLIHPWMRTTIVVKNT